MKSHAHRPRRTISIAGEPLGLAEITLGAALGVLFAVTASVCIWLALALLR